MECVLATQGILENGVNHAGSRRLKMDAYKPAPSAVARTMAGVQISD